MNKFLVGIKEFFSRLKLIFFAENKPSIVLDRQQKISEKRKSKSIIKKLRKDLPIEYQLLSSILYQSVIGPEKIRFIDLHVRFSDEKAEQFKAWCNNFEEENSTFIYYRQEKPGKRTIKDELRPFANEDGLLTDAAVIDLQKKLERIHGRKLSNREALKEQLVVEKFARRDLTNEPALTIDSPQASHFEDALYCSEMPDGSLKLKIHFIDPTYYLSETGSIVQGAYDAGLSLYADKAYTIIDRSIIENELSFITNHQRPAFTVEATWSEDTKKWNTSIYQSLINVKQNLKIGFLDQADANGKETLNLISKAVSSLYSKNKSLAELNLEPFARVFEDRKGVEYLADCMIFAKSQLAKFLKEFKARVIWRSNKPFNEIDREAFIKRLEKLNIIADSSIFDDAKKTIDIFKNLQVQNQRRLLGDLVGFLIGRSVYSVSAHGFKPLGLGQYLEIKCRDASGLYNSFRLSELLNSTPSEIILSEAELQNFADRLNQKRKGYDLLLFRARFLEALIRHLPSVGEVKKAKLVNVANLSNKLPSEKFCSIDGYRFPLILEADEIPELNSEEIYVKLVGFSLDKMRFKAVIAGV
jgi:hypothetical protein